MKSLLEVDWADLRKLDNLLTWSEKTSGNEIDPINAESNLTVGVVVAVR